MEEGVASVIRTILTELPVLKHPKFKFSFCKDEQELEAITEAIIENGQNLKTIDLPFLKPEKEIGEQLLEKLPELHSVGLHQMVVTRVEKGQIHVKKCQEKTQNRGCRVAYPTPRHDEEDFGQRHHHGEFGQRHNHRDFLDAMRNRRYRIQVQPIDLNAAGQIAAINESNRQYLRRYRQQARIRAFQRYIER